jgi:hypothetical protein
MSALMLVPEVVLMLYDFSFTAPDELLAQLTGQPRSAVYAMEHLTIRHRLSTIPSKSGLQRSTPSFSVNLTSFTRLFWRGA